MWNQLIIELETTMCPLLLTKNSSNGMTSPSIVITLTPFMRELLDHAPIFLKIQLHCHCLPKWQIFKGLLYQPKAMQSKLDAYVLSLIHSPTNHGQNGSPWLGKRSSTTTWRHPAPNACISDPNRNSFLHLGRSASDLQHDWANLHACHALDQAQCIL